MSMPKEKVLGANLPEPVILLAWMYLWQSDRGIARKVCRHWYQASKHPMAQKLFWKYPLRLSLEGSQDMENKQPLSVAVWFNTIFCTSLKKQTIGTWTLDTLNSQCALEKKNESRLDIQEMSVPGGQSFVQQVAVDVPTNQMAWTVKQSFLQDYSDHILIMDTSLKADLSHVTWPLPKGLMNFAINKSRLYMAFEECFSIYEMDGTLVRSWGLPPALTFPNTWSHSRKLCVFEKKIYISDTGSSCVWVYSLEGSLLLKWGSCGKAAGQFVYNYGISVNETGVYVVDRGNWRIQVFTHDGVLLFQQAMPQAEDIRDIVYHDGICFVTDTHKILREHQGIFYCKLWQLRAEFESASKCGA